jgi:hypothetical protein
MWMKPDAYFKRLQLALDQVVAPEIEDDYVRGQLYAVTELLAQLGGKLEFKRDLAAVEITEAEKARNALLDGLRANEIEVPPELTALNFSGRPADLDLLREVEAALCAAIDLFSESKTRLDPSTAARLDQSLREYLTKTATRDMGLLKPPQLDKISRSKRPERRER